MDRPVPSPVRTLLYCLTLSRPLVVRKISGHMMTNRSLWSRAQPNRLVKKVPDPRVKSPKRTKRRTKANKFKILCIKTNDKTIGLLKNSI